MNGFYLSIIFFDMSLPNKARSFIFVWIGFFGLSKVLKTTVGALFNIEINSHAGSPWLTRVGGTAIRDLHLFIRKMINKKCLHNGI
jgi:hypothetical protein